MKGTDINEAVKKVVTDYRGYDKCSCCSQSFDRNRNWICKISETKHQLSYDTLKLLCQLNGKKVVVKISNINRGANRALTHTKFGILLLHIDIRW